MSELEALPAPVARRPGRPRKIDRAEADASDVDAPLEVGRIRTAPVPLEIRDAWKRMLKKSTLSNAMLRAVYRAAVLGDSWKRAAKVEGVTMQSVWDNARRYGLAGRNRRLAKDGFDRIVGLSQDLIEERLTAKKPDIKTKDVAIVLGIAAEHATKLTQDEEATSTYAGFLDRLAQSIEAGGTVALSLTVTRPEHPTGTPSALPEECRGAETLEVFRVTPPAAAAYVPPSGGASPEDPPA